VSLLEYAVNYYSPDAPQTTEEKLDAILAGQSGSSGFAAPSSKTRRVNLSGATGTKKLTKATSSKPTAFVSQNPAVVNAAQNILNSNNPIVADAIRRVGGRSPAGPRIKLDFAAQAVPAPTPRPRPTPVKTKMA
tara:strand:+ start:53 stop:454 length:402 start_codon:yes stop_codon:yes gene_type:complete